MTSRDTPLGQTAKDWGFTLIDVHDERHLYLKGVFVMGVDHHNQTNELQIYISAYIRGYVQCFNDILHSNVTSRKHTS